MKITVVTRQAKQRNKFGWEMNVILGKRFVAGGMCLILIVLPRPGDVRGKICVKITRASH